LETPSFDTVAEEFNRAKRRVEGLNPAPVMELVPAPDGLPGQPATLDHFCRILGAPTGPLPPFAARDGELPCKPTDHEARHKRQFDELVEYTQVLLHESPKRREAFWSKADFSSAEAFAKTSAWYRDYFWD